MQRIFTPLAATIATLAAISLCSCGGKSDVRPTSPLSPEARAEATRAVEMLISVEHGSEMQLQDALLHARALQSKYLLLGDTIAAQDFEMCYDSTLQSRNPELYNLIF